MLVFSLANNKVMLYYLNMNKAFNKACDIVGCANLARYLGVSPQAINGWKKGKRPLPTDRCAAIEQATNGQVTRKDLRPDDWESIWPELAQGSKRRTDDKKH